MRKVKGQKGFSLMELMVVIAIIGILAAIGMPQITNWLAKAKRVEAKTNLGSLYTSMKAFFAEHQQYYTDFRAVGYAPEGDLRYRVGFAAAGINGPAKAELGIFNNAAATQFSTNTYCAGAPAGTCQEITAPGVALALPAGATMTAATFVAGAAGDVDGDAGLDVWTINQVKRLTLVTDDM